MMREFGVEVFFGPPRFVNQHVLELTRQMDSVETVASCLVFLTRLRLAQDDVASAGLKA